MDIDLVKLEELKKKLKQRPTDKKVRLAVERLLKDPTSLDKAIDLLGISHECDWLPNRKRALWNIVDNRNYNWIIRCVERILKNEKRELALYSLLNSNAIDTLRAIVPTAKDIVVLWDVKGAETTGIGLASRRKDVFTNYFYIGWKTTDEERRIVRVEFATKIPNILGKSYLSGAMTLTKWIWAELPYRFCAATTDRQTFDEEDLWITKPFGYTREIVKILKADGATPYVKL